MASPPPVTMKPTLPTGAGTTTLEDFDNVPLFMKSLPTELGGTADLQAAEGASDTFAALQALAYEGDPSEIAEGFRQQGNDLFKQRKFRDAIGFYTRAIDEVGKDLDLEERRTLWGNRAAANLELKNYGATLRDCSLVLSAGNSNFPSPPTSTANKTTLKSLLRSGRALTALDKLEEATDALVRLKAMEEELGMGEQDSGKRYREELGRKILAKEKREAEKKEKERRKIMGDAAVVLALQSRGVIFPKPTVKTPLFKHAPTDVLPPHFDEDIIPLHSLPSVPLLPPAADSPSFASYVPWSPAPHEAPLIFPVFLLLPLASPSSRDLITAFPESATFGDALQSMGRDPADLQLYLSTKQGRVLKIGAKLTLGKVLAAAGKGKEGEMERDGWELKEGWALEMVGVPKGARGEEWIQEWKKEQQSEASKKAIL